MKDRDQFAANMAALGVAFNREVGKPLLNLYWMQLEDLTDQEFAESARLAVQREKFFPPVAVLRELARPFVDPNAEAVEAFERVVKLAEHDPRTGSYWRLGRIAEEVGDIAAEAYVAAGATRAFAHELQDRDAPFLRKRFVDAYVTAWEAKRQGRKLALPESVARALPGSPVADLVNRTAKVLQMDRKRLASGETP
jgi:hypothetical protein